MAERQPDRARVELEALWLDRVQAACEQRALAAAHCKRVLGDLTVSLTTEPDGSFAVRQARLAESHARSEYMRTLRVFTDLVIHGKIPDEL